MIFQLPKHNLDKNFLNIYKNLNKIGILGKYSPRLNFPDEPQFYQYACERPSGSVKGKTGFGFGCSDKESEAFKIAVSEAIEHYCILFERDDLFIKNSFNELSEKAIDPLRFIPFSKIQLKDKKYKKFLVNHDTKLNWLEGYSLTNNRKTLLPASMVYANYNHKQKGEPILQITNSNGAACGETQEFAIYRGICEIIERDAYLISFINNLPKKIISVEHDKKLTDFKKRIERYNLEVFFISTKLDLSPSTITCLIIDKTGSGPAVCAGLGGDLSQRNAIITSGYEAVRRHISGRDRFFRSEPLPIPPKYSYDWFINQKQLLWNAPHMIKTAEKMLNGEKIDFVETNNNFPQDYKGKVKQLVKELKIKGMEVIMVDVTVPEVKKEGMRVIKVIIPEMVPFWRDERYPYLGIKRLYEVPKIMGYNSKFLYNEKDAFNIHPF